MEYINGNHWPSNPTPGQRDNLKKILSLFHGEGFVHGDLRGPNILVVDDVVKVIDFNWAGKIGEAWYRSLYPQKRCEMA